MKQPALHLSQDLLQDYAAGILPPSAEERIELHIFSCTDCEQRLSSILQATTDARPDFEGLRQLLADQGLPVPPTSAVASAGPSRNLLRFWPYAAAASLALLLAAYLFWPKKQESSSQWTLAASSVVRPSLSPHASTSDPGQAWKEAYQKENWTLVNQLLSPKLDTLAAQPDSIDAPQSELLNALGLARLKLNPGQPLAAEPAFSLVNQRSSERNARAIARYFLGLMYVLNRDPDSADDLWQEALQDVHLADQYKSEIRRLMAASENP